MFVCARVCEWPYKIIFREEEGEGGRESVVREEGEEGEVIRGSRED